MSLSEKDQIRNQNLGPLANLTDLVAGVVIRIAGNEISNSLDGKLVSGAHMRQLVAARVNQAVAQKTGAV